VVLYLFCVGNGAVFLDIGLNATTFRICSLQAVYPHDADHPTVLQQPCRSWGDQLLAASE
jgi:hypothetical protein